MNQGNLTQDEKAKWRYTYTTLGMFIGWAAFAVWMTYRAASTGTDTDIFAASGTNVVLGVLAAKWSDAHQFWFRRSRPKDTE